MATLKLVISGEGRRHTLVERGEQYEQLWRFRDATEAKDHFCRLDLPASQIAELWAGKEVELSAKHSWSGIEAPEREEPPTHPTAVDGPNLEERFHRC